jgi:hypothetical protein
LPGISRPSHLENEVLVPRFEELIH